MSSLKLSEVNKVYPSGEIGLYGINLEASDKEFLVIVGGEKSGKSTLIRVAAGLEDVTDGEVVIDGKDVSDADPRERDVAVVFRNDMLNANLNVYENMAYGLKQRKTPQALIDRRVKVVAEMLGLTEALYRKPKALTAAAKQRVAIARAVVREPGLYFFDEPLSGLDEKLRRDMLNVLINLQARLSGTFVYATKNLSEAMTIGTRIVVMKDGFMQQADTPSNLYDYPANTYVAFYIGSPTINFLNGAKIIKSDAGYAAVSGDIKLDLPENIVTRFENIAEYADADKTVIIGIRPEDAALVKSGGAFGARVGKTEKDGENVYAEAQINGGISMIVRGESNLFAGEEAEVEVNTERLYVFDGETRLTLLARDDGYKKTEFADAGFTPLPYGEEQNVLKNLKGDKNSKKK